jgi:uncharacterized protein
MPTAPRAHRHDSLDTLRGLAVLGILLVNIQSFAMVWVAADTPIAHMDFTSSINRGVWAVTQIFFSTKFITLFTAMFGAGVVLMLGEDEASHHRHFRRMIWLLLIGLVHGYVFWFGDVLAPYALAGMVVVTARRMSVAGLVGLALGLIAFTGLLEIAYSGYGALIGETVSPAAALGFGVERIAQIETLYQSGFLERLPYNLGLTLQWQLIQIVFLGAGIAGVMLLGMAALKTGFMTLEWEVKHYAVSGGVALLVGLLLCGWSALHALGTNFALTTAWQGAIAQYLGSLVLAYAYAALVMLVCKLAILPAVRNTLADVGRMAFTNYLSQTLILTLIFVGFPGLGLFGQVERGEQALIVVILWIAQLVWSPLWLQHFCYGPMEWAWRSLTYGKAQAWRRPVDATEEIV